MIHGCIYRGQSLNFYTKIHSESNVFTTIVGRNGSGKSRLLRDLINNFADVNEMRRDRDIKDVSNIDVVYAERPSNVIASSTSPFDKFPIAQALNNFNFTLDNYYFYQGLRGLGSTNLGLSFMGRTLGGLIKALNYDTERVGTVMGVLDYLGYNEIIVARFVLDVPQDFIKQVSSGVDPVEEINKYLLTQPRMTIHTRKIRGLLNQLADREQVENFASALRDFLISFSRPRIDVVISRSGAIDAISGNLLTEHFTVLYETGVLRLRDVSLSKKGFKEAFTINDASSGEQCVLMALIGIAANIKDGSLICIDEPEICLHPEWQERYIKLLMSTFREFKGCHFIIATHSPQIISKLADENCYVLDLQSGKIFDAVDFNNRSADFQLASIFRAPGYKNEYLTRELLNALATLGSGREIPADRLAVLEDLSKLRSVIEQDDPVGNLFDLLDGALEAKSNG